MELRAVLFMLCLGWLCQACTPGSTTVEQQGDFLFKDGVVYYSGPLNADVRSSLPADPQTFHPVNSYQSSKVQINSYLYESLISLDIATGEFVPDLAVALPTRSEDGLSYDFEIHPDAAWNDGRPVTAKDVEFSIKAILCPLSQADASRNLFEYIESLTIDSDNPKKFRITMTDYYFNNDYFGSQFVVLDQKFFDPEDKLANYSIPALKEGAESLSEDPELIAFAEYFNGPACSTDEAVFQAGSGGYYIESWTPGQEIVLKRNEKYWGKNLADKFHATKPEHIFFQIVSDQAALEVKIQNEELDVVTHLIPPSYAALLEDSLVNTLYNLSMTPRPSFVFIALNNRPDGVNQNKLFDDPTVRNAMALALPMDQIIDEILEGMAQRTSSPVPNFNMHYHDGLELVAFDQEKAKELLESAGWKDLDGDGVREKEVDGKLIPLSFEFLYPPQGQLYEDFVARLEYAWKQIGVECIPTPQPPAQYQRAVLTHDYVAALMATSSASVPYDFKQLFHSDSWLNGNNFFGFANEEADGLIDALRVERDPAARKEMANRIQEILLADMPILPLYVPMTKIAVHKRFNHGEAYPFRFYVNMNQMEMLRPE
ncbi:ABC transporter substrate-binding protein [Pontibacter sp. G13]|uniref:ABC transporter substrate-binding protein n=1 Tax=Pontibacter sp. G13 TaxID=3074898 RepID=UPI00288C44E5|nr:ABC transporter substrate-binding protein [Pontibacter sp. G13]WNJ21278.1 ABC transporter substrate-binding protein [Pontibacter sp. G13]